MKFKKADWRCARCQKTRSARTPGVLWPVFFSDKDALICKACARVLTDRIREREFRHTDDENDWFYGIGYEVRTHAG